MGRKAHVPLREDAELVLPAEESLQASCDPARRRMYVLHSPKVEGFWAPAVHANCLHNEEAALRLRTLGPTPRDPDDMGPGTVSAPFQHQIGLLRNLVRKLNVVRWDRAEVVASYAGRLRRRYHEAMVSLDVEGDVEPADSRLSAFLKAEKFNPLQKASKPRMIMARTPRYNLELARYLKPLEHAIWNRWLVGRGGVARSRMVGKGLNHVQRAKLLRRKMDDVGDCVVFEIDGKAFEAHVTSGQVAAEHSVYKAAFPRAEELRRLLAAQSILSGKTSCGVRYRRQGCRASGDFNTGLGNTIIMGCATEAVLALLEVDLGMFRSTVLADGDNCLVFVERRVAHLVAERFPTYIARVAGQELTVEKPVSVLEEITFGQSKPCYNGEEYIMVRDPVKSISNSFSGYRHYNHYGFGLRLAKSICIAELSLVRGVPLLEPYYAAALGRLRDVRELTNPEDYLGGHLIGVPYDPRVKARGVTMESRNSFALAWGIGIEEQLSLEESLVRSLDTFPHPGYLDEVVEVADESCAPIDDERIAAWTYIGEKAVM